jgi:hypothetical protein
MNSLVVFKVQLADVPAAWEITVILKMLEAYQSALVVVVMQMSVEITFLNIVPNQETRELSLHLVLPHALLNLPLFYVSPELRLRLKKHNLTFCFSVAGKGGFHFGVLIVLLSLNLFMLVA